MLPEEVKENYHWKRWSQTFHYSATAKLIEMTELDQSLGKMTQGLSVQFPELTTK